MSAINRPTPESPSKFEIIMQLEAQVRQHKLELMNSEQFSRENWAEYNPMNGIELVPARGGLVAVRYGSLFTDGFDCNLPFVSGISL